MSPTKDKTHRPLRNGEYVALAEFRYQLRKFQHYMQDQVRALGVNPQQYQLVLAIKGLPQEQVPTIGALAERMQLNHNSSVERVDRSEKRGLLRRERGQTDRREVRLTVTSRGEALLRKLGSSARSELLESGSALVDAVQQLTRGVSNHRGPAKKS